MKRRALIWLIGVATLILAAAALTSCYGSSIEPKRMCEITDVHRVPLVNGLNDTLWIESKITVKIDCRDTVTTIRRIP